MTDITREQALDHLLSGLHPDTRALVEGIIDAAPSSRNTDDLRRRMEATVETQQSAVAALRVAILGGACTWIEEAKKLGAGEEEAYRIAAVTLEWSCAMLVRRLHQKLGEPFSPGRFAIVACDQARAACEFPMGLLDSTVAEAEALATASTDGGDA